MDGHEAQTVGELLLDEIEQVLGIQFGRVARLAGGLLEGLIERNVAHRPGGGGQHRPANGIQITAGGKLHERVGAFLFGGHGLSDLQVDVADVRRGADGGVDLGAQTPADAHHLLPFSKGVVGDDDLSAGDPVTHQFRIHLLIGRHRQHLLGDNALPGPFNLRFHIGLLSFRSGAAACAIKKPRTENRFSAWGFAITTKTHYPAAGLLTRGSFYRLPLPAPFRSCSYGTVVIWQRSSPLTATGSSRNRTGFPIIPGTPWGVRAPKGSITSCGLLCKRSALACQRICLVWH